MWHTSINNCCEPCHCSLSPPTTSDYTASLEDLSCDAITNTTICRPSTPQYLLHILNRQLSIIPTSRITLRMPRLSRSRPTFLCYRLNTSCLYLRKVFLLLLRPLACLAVAIDTFYMLTVVAVYDSWTKRGKATLVTLAATLKQGWWFKNWLRRSMQLGCRR